MQLPASHPADDDCFVRPDLAEFTIELAPTRSPGTGFRHQVALLDRRERRASIIDRLRSGLV